MGVADGAEEDEEAGGAGEGGVDEEEAEKGLQHLAPADCEHRQVGKQGRRA